MNVGNISRGLLSSFMDPEIPRERSGHAAVVRRGFIYVWGGYCTVSFSDGEGPADSHERRHDPRIIWKYHLRHHTWTKVLVEGYAPPSLLGSCYACVNGQLIIFGGYGRAGDDNNVYILCLNKMKWRQVQLAGSSPSPRNKLACCAYGHRMVYFGGYGPEPEEHQINNGQYDPDYSTVNLSRGWNNHLFAFDMQDNSWVTLPNLGCVPSTRAAHSCASIDNKAFFFGGRHLGERLDDLYLLCLDTYCWTAIKKIGDGPVGRSWHSLTPTSDDTLYLFGGLDTNYNILSDGWIFDIKNSTWSKVRDGLHKRLWHTACVGSYMGQVVVYGGCESCIYLSHPKYSNKITMFNLQPKTLLQTCLDVLADDKRSWETQKDVLPHTLYHKLVDMIGNGG